MHRVVLTTQTIYFPSLLVANLHLMGLGILFHRLMAPKSTILSFQIQQKLCWCQILKPHVENRIARIGIASMPCPPVSCSIWAFEICNWWISWSLASRRRFNISLFPMEVELILKLCWVATINLDRWVAFWWSKINHHICHHLMRSF